MCDDEMEIFIDELMVMVDIGRCYVKFFGDYNFIYFYGFIVKLFGFY